MAGKDAGQLIRERYPDKTAMGQLDFDLLDFKKLAADTYFVGKWHLARTIGDLSGHFTLVIERSVDSGRS